MGPDSVEGQLKNPTGGLVRIFIVDDHPIIRQSLRSLLEREEGLAICGEAAKAETALEQIETAAPDLVLIDVSLPGVNGIELARMLRQQYPDLLLAMLSGHGERSHVEQALQAGANGYLLKGSAEELPVAIRQILSGEQYLSTEFKGLAQNTK